MLVLCPPALMAIVPSGVFLALAEAAERVQTERLCWAPLVECLAQIVRGCVQCIAAAPAGAAIRKRQRDCNRDRGRSCGQQLGRFWTAHSAEHDWSDELLSDFLNQASRHLSAGEVVIFHNRKQTQDIQVAERYTLNQVC